MRLLVSCLFLVSGTCGLIYEVVWAKYLVLVIGNMAHAHALILATFLGGLALGNTVFGRYADRAGRALLLYGFLEIGVGILGALSPALFTLLTSSYLPLMAGADAAPGVGLAARIGFSSILMLAPTFLMGGTLPVLCRFVSRDLSRHRADIGWLYFINSSGAVMGSLLAGFVLIPLAGLDLSIQGAALMNIAVGLTAIGFVPRAEREAQAPLAAAEKEPSIPDFVPTRRQSRSAYAVAFLSGIASLLLETAWIRHLSIVLGSSAYSFALMLSAFIAGIAGGAYLIRSGVGRRYRAFNLLGAAEAGIALLLLASIPFFDRLPWVFKVAGYSLPKTTLGFYGHEIVTFGLCFLIMAGPAVLIGMTLPLASACVNDDLGSVGRKVGGIFGVNTAGNILGAVIGGAVLMPWIGTRGIFHTAAFLNVACAVIIWAGLDAPLRTRAAISLSTAGLAFLLAWLPGSWDAVALTMGEFRTRSRPSLSYEKYKKAFEGWTAEYHRDSTDATVSVIGWPTEDGKRDLALKVNGKPDATIYGDLPTQILTGQIPMLLSPAGVRNALVVGLGSGITAGTLLSHPIEHLDLVEISRGVVEANRFFTDHNRRALFDPRLTLHVEDARTFVLRPGIKYDLVVSEPSNPWIAGVGNLFTLEFYDQVKRRLSPGGLMAQWFHSYEMDDATLGLVLRTFSAAFEHVTVWQTMGNDLLLVGSRRPVAPDFDAIAAKTRIPEVRAELARVGVASIGGILARQLLSDVGVREAAGAGPLNRDRAPLLEYQAPVALFLQEASRLVRDHDERLKPRRKLPVNAIFEGIYLTDYVDRNARLFGSQDFEQLLADPSVAGVPAIATVLSTQWLERFPGNADARYYAARAALGMGDTTKAKMIADFIVPAADRNVKYLELAADIEIRLAKSSDVAESDRAYSAARAYLIQLTRLKPKDRVDEWLKLGDLTYVRNTSESVSYYASAVREARGYDDFRSDDPSTLANAAVAAWQLGDSTAAKDLLDTAARLDSTEPAVRSAKILIQGS